MHSGGSGRMGVDLIELARQRAEPYVGETETVDELVTGIVELALEDPSRARQLVESIAAAADDATEGRHTEQVDSVERLVLYSLGLDAENLVNSASSDSDTAPEVVDGTVVDDTE